MYRTKLSKVKCGKCQLLVPLRLWREHVLQHTALKIFKLPNYPPSFLQLTKHYCGMLEEQDYKDRKGIAQLTSAYDTLKMLYFKDFKECSDDSPMVSPSFEKMAEALAPQNHNYTSWETESNQNTLPPPPYSFGLKIRQLQESIFHSEELLQELRQTFFTADPITPELCENEGVLWGSCLFEGLKGNAAARHVTDNYWDHVREILGSNTYPSPPDIRRAMKKSLHKLDVSLKQGYDEVGQSRWSGVAGCVCILQTTPLSDVSDLDNSRASTKLSHNSPEVTHGSTGMVHIANIGSVGAVMSRDGSPKQITYTHTVVDKAERERVISNGAVVSSSGQVNCVTTVTRALGFHGDPTLRQCLSQKPYCNTVPLLPNDEYIIIANSTFWKYLGPKEACHMCKAVLNPSLRKLIHIYTTIPGKDQDEALSQVSSLDYDALVSDFGDDNSKDSSMVPDNESEKNIKLVKFNLLIKMATNLLAKKFEEQNEDEEKAEEKGKSSKTPRTKSGNLMEDVLEGENLDDDEIPSGDVINWDEIFDDPLENLSLDKVCKALSENMSNCLVDGAQQAGALGPISCSVILLHGSVEAVKRRLYYEQAIHELKKMYSDYAMSDVSLMSNSGDDVSVVSAPSATPLVPPSSDALDQYDQTISQSPTSIVSRQFPAAVPENTVVQPDIAEHMTLDPGKLVFRESCGVLKLVRSMEKPSYTNLKLEALKLEDLTNVLSKQDQRAMVRDMISQVILENTTPEPNESEQLNVQSLDPTSASSPTAATVS